MFTRRTLFALAVLLPTASGVADDPPDPVAYPVVTHLTPLAADGLDIPPQTLTVDERKGWIVVTLEVDPTPAENEEGEEGAFADSGETTGALGSDRAAAEAAEGGLEWAIVLAEADPDVRPRIEVVPGLPIFRVNYGPYFVRDSIDTLRAFRQKKVRLDETGAFRDEEPSWSLDVGLREGSWSGWSQNEVVRVAALERDGLVLDPLPAADRFKEWRIRHRIRPGRRRVEGPVRRSDPRSRERLPGGGDRHILNGRRPADPRA